MNNKKIPYSRQSISSSDIKEVVRTLKSDFLELSEIGILANSVGPGFIDTDLTRSVLGEKGIAEVLDQIPIKRLGRANEIASLVSWLVSNENTYISGQNIMIDGGFTRV